MIPEGELDAIRADAEELLLAQGRRHVREVTRDAGGSSTATFVAGPESPCRIAPMAGGEGGSMGERVDDRTTHVLTLPAGTAIDQGDRFEVYGAGMYEVTLIRRRTFDELVRRVEVKEVS